MSLARFSFSPRLPTLWRDVDEMFEAPTHEFSPPADILETDKHVEIRLDLPGVNPEAIDVKLEGKTLTITAERKDEKVVEEKGWLRRERRQGMYSRAFALNETLDGTKPEATYRHGVLTVTLPKREAAQPRSLKVKVEA